MSRTGRGRGDGTPASPPCDRCAARCCRYFALEIDRPVTPADHDRIRWFLVHERTAVWVEGGDWYLEVRNECRSLERDGKCGIYATRPHVCREYGMPESEDRCEYYEDELSFDLLFESAEAFDAWSRETLRAREERLKRRREKRRRSPDLPREAIA